MMPLYIVLWLLPIVLQGCEFAPRLKGLMRNRRGRIHKSKLCRDRKWLRLECICERRLHRTVIQNTLFWHVLAV